MAALFPSMGLSHSISIGASDAQKSSAQGGNKSREKIGNPNELGFSVDGSYSSKNKEGVSRAFLSISLPVLALLRSG